MKGKKIIIISIIINILSIGVIYNLIKKDYLNNEKIIVKAMTEKEYEDSIKSLNTSHEDFVNYIKESKTKIASAITDMGIETSENTDANTMASNIRSIRNNIDVGYDYTNGKTITSGTTITEDGLVVVDFWEGYASININNVTVIGFYNDFNTTSLGATISAKVYEGDLLTISTYSAQQDPRITFYPSK